MASMELELRLVKDRLSTLEFKFDESNINTTNPNNLSKDRVSQGESRPTYTHHNRYYSIHNANGGKSNRQYNTPRNSQPVPKKKFDTFTQSKDFSCSKTPKGHKSTGIIITLNPILIERKYYSVNTGGRDGFGLLDTSGGEGNSIHRNMGSSGKQGTKRYGIFFLA
jgi:hypothetical protein